MTTSSAHLAMANPMMTFLMPKIKVVGEVVSSNLDKVEEKASKYFDQIKTDLKTDDEFYLASEQVKQLKIYETNLSKGQEEVMKEIEEVATLLKRIDHLSEKARGKRLILTKLIEEKKKEIKGALIDEYSLRFDEHFLKTTGEEGEHLIRQGLVEVIKGLSSINSMKSKLVQYYFESTKIIDINHQLVKESKYPYLFQDRGLLFQPTEEVKTVIEDRVKKEDDRKEKEREKEEERKRREQIAQKEREAKRIQEEADKKKREEAAQREREEAHRKQREREQERKEELPEHVQEEEISKPTGGQGYEVRADDKVTFAHDREKVERYIDSIKLPEFPELRHWHFIQIQNIADKNIANLKKFLRKKLNKIGETK